MIVCSYWRGLKYFNDIFEFILYGWGDYYNVFFFKFNMQIFNLTTMIIMYIRQRCEINFILIRCIDYLVRLAIDVV